MQSKFVKKVLGRDDLEAEKAFSDYLSIVVNWTQSREFDKIQIKDKKSNLP
jgi:hypothetical protein